MRVESFVQDPRASKKLLLSYEHCGIALSRLREARAVDRTLPEVVCQRRRPARRCKEVALSSWAIHFKHLTGGFRQ